MKKIQEIAHKMQNDPQIKGKDAVIIALDLVMDCATDSAYFYTTDGQLTELEIECTLLDDGTDENRDQTQVFDSDGDNLVSFHLTRSGKGVRTIDEDTNADLVVFVNVSTQSMTVDGVRVAPGAFTYFQSFGPGTPEYEALVEKYWKKQANSLEFLENI